MSVTLLPQHRVVNQAKNTAMAKNGGVSICNRKRSINDTDNEHEEIASNENISRLTTLPVPLLYVAKSFGQANLYVTVNAERIFVKQIKIVNKCNSILPATTTPQY